MISYSRPEYIVQLKTMWHKIFGDSERYLDSFFDKVYKAENTLVYLKRDTVVSALYMIPYSMLIDGEEKEIIYLYALATKPAYRGKRIMSQLIQRSLDISTERGYALSILVPSDNTLFEYYRRYGYVECFEQVKVTKTLEEIEKEATDQKLLTLIKADAGQIWDVYSHSEFFTSDCIILSQEQNKFYIEEVEKEGGEAFVFKIERNKDGYALLQLIDDEVVIYETNVGSYDLGSFYVALLAKYEFKAVTFYQPLCFSEEEMQANKKPFAMSKKLQDISLTKPFINRVLI